MKLKFAYLILSVIFIQGLSGCTDSSATTVTPDKIVQGFYQALNDGDVESALTFIADDIECRGHCYITGKDSFQAFIQGNIDHHDRFEISDLKVDGNTVTFNYIIHRENTVLARGVDSVMRVQDGKIIYFEIK
jgi:ketosteroid isomerase-like protein